MPWLSCSVPPSSLTQAPGVIGVLPPPSAVSQERREARGGCGRNGLMGALLPADLGPVGDLAQVDVLELGQGQAGRGVGAAARRIAGGPGDRVAGQPDEADAAGDAPRVAGLRRPRRAGVVDAEVAGAGRVGGVGLQRRDARRGAVRARDGRRRWPSSRSGRRPCRWPGPRRPSCTAATRPSGGPCRSRGRAGRADTRWCPSRRPPRRPRAGQPLWAGRPRPAPR